MYREYGEDRVTAPAWPIICKGIIDAHGGASGLKTCPMAGVQLKLTSVVHGSQPPRLPPKGAGMKPGPHIWSSKMSADLSAMRGLLERIPRDHGTAAGGLKLVGGNHRTVTWTWGART